MESTVRGKCIDYAHDGRGVIRVDNFPVFVEGLLLGEEAIIKIVRQCKAYFLGVIVERLTTSKSRIEPLCPIYKQCGGCHLQHMCYDEQLRFKKNRVYEALKRIGKVDVKVNDVIGMDNPYHYRNKIQVPFGLNNQNKIIAGFYKKNSHEIIDMEECLIEDNDGDIIINSCKEIFTKLDIKPYNENSKKGIIRHVLVRKGTISQQIMVVIITKTVNVDKIDRVIELLVKKHPTITTIVQNINPTLGNIILGEKEKVLYGKGFIEDTLCGLRFRISAKSFYQVNHHQTEVLYQKAIQLANLSKEDRVLDAYCGVGTIGLIASRYAGHVAGVESVQEAINNAIDNAKHNNVTNISFYCDDAGTFMKKTVENKITIDVVFIDPPRNGCSETFINSLLDLKPQRLVYISCEPSSLARDINILKQYYEVRVVQPVDMFPHTYHVETIVVLFRK